MSSAIEAQAGHAARMDAIYGAQRHIYDLTRKYYLLGRDRLIRDLAVPAGGGVLEVGCGTGRNLALAGRRYPGARLHGLDISAEMLKSARATLGEGAVLARADATAFDAEALFGREGFDRVFLSYTLSMIPDWRGAIRAGLAVVAPGGSLHIVDFGQQARLPRWFRAGLRGWLARFHVTPRAELIEACAALAAEAGCKITVARRYRDYAWSVVMTRAPDERCPTPSPRT